MPAKAPIYLKQAGKNGQVGGKGGKKLRDILSTEMISPPLGDFRHMAHVGRGGKDDMFGDTTFLKNSNSNGTTTGNSKGIPAFHSFRRKGTGKSLKKYRNSSVADGEHSEDRPGFKRIENGYGPLESPILQTAVSLPLLNQEGSSGPATPTHTDEVRENGKRTENNNSIPANEAQGDINAAPESHLMGPPKPRRITNDDGRVPNGHGVGPKPKTEPKQAAVTFSDTTSIDESWSLELDLGTSLMDDVIGVMDKIEL